MEADRLSTGEKISAVSAVLLFVFMFFDWFGAEVASVTGFSGEVDGGGSAWDTLDVIPIFLMAAIVVAIGVAVIRLTDADLEPPISLNTFVAVLGALAFLLILYRIIDPPGGEAFAGVTVDTTRKIGIFLGLAAAAGIAYGGFSAMREEGVTFADAADRLGGGYGGTQPPPGGQQPGAPGQGQPQPQQPPPGQQPPPPPPSGGQQPPPPPSSGQQPPPPPPSGGEQPPPPPEQPPPPGR